MTIVNGAGPKNLIPGTKDLAPGEARTHNPGIPHCTVYKYRALTDCATGAMWPEDENQIDWQTSLSILPVRLSHRQTAETSKGQKRSQKQPPSKALSHLRSTFFYQPTCQKTSVSWRCRGSNPGPHTCKACALPLSYIPCASFGGPKKISQQLDTIWLLDSAHGR